MGTPGVAIFLVLFVFELLRNLPGMLRLRRKRRRFHAGIPADPGVVCVSDNLDEVNGIALASRIQLRELRRLGHRAFLFGTAFRERVPRREADGLVTLSPGIVSIDQAGYPHSEMVVPRLASFLEFLDENPVDFVEFETPGAVSILCLVAARVIGIPTASHYRTDMMTYSELLLKNRLGVAIVQAGTKLFTRLAGPVIVPSEAYRRKVEAMGIAPNRIHKLPRGVDLTVFNPENRAPGFWRDLGIPEDGIKLLYVGRVSAEKNLAELCPAFEEALRAQPRLRLIVVGDGPYLETMKERLAGCERAHFTGVLRDEALGRAFASADLFVFPSLTDTFGNSVIEALASGLPALVSDEGGPSEIVVPGACGEIFRHDEPHALREGILALAGDPARLARYREGARARAAEFTYEAAAQGFWNFYLSRLRGR
jgi:glycosyltransferase involved in cell wall biosynthesis